MSCKLCNRKFGSTPNPMVKDPEKDDLLKQRGSLAQCSPCFFYIKSGPKLKDMNRTDLMQKMANDQSFKMEFMNGLSAWEADRREGKRKKRCDSTQSVSTETKCGVSTKQIKGYLWPRDMLDKHNLGHLCKKGKLTTISHMGKPITGVLRESWVLGAIEVAEDRFLFHDCLTTWVLKLNDVMTI